MNDELLAYQRSKDQKKTEEDVGNLWSQVRDSGLSSWFTLAAAASSKRGDIMKAAMALMVNSFRTASTLASLIPDKEARPAAQEEAPAPAIISSKWALRHHG